MDQMNYENSYLFNILSTIKTTNKTNIVNLIFLNTEKESIKDMELRLDNVVNDKIPNEQDKILFIHSSGRNQIRNLTTLIFVEEYKTLLFSRRLLNKVKAIIDGFESNPRTKIFDYVFYTEP